jgi:saccharopine dehydrogenase-like NADP-dependent oxidoreductase
MHRILVLGGYGFFGGRICAALARNPRIQLIIAGRSAEKATALAYQVGLRAENARALDAASPQFSQTLSKLAVNTLIHTAGPFQGQDYSVAQAAIQAGANYLDLADGREFVGGIGKLDAAARAANVAVVSGASSLPALTSAVVDRYLQDFARLDSVRSGITSGALVPGLATMRAVLGYCGQSFRVLENGQWVTVHGWLDTVEHNFPKPVGPRLLGRCDVPDLDLLPRRYPSLKTASFHAGFASQSAHRGVERLAMLVRDGKLKSALPFARALNTIARWLQPIVSDRGAMFVTMEGLHDNGAPLKLTWNLVARENDGPNIPCAAAIALANKLASGRALPPGAMPCMGLLNVDELMEPLKGLSIREFPPPTAGGVPR